MFACYLLPLGVLELYLRQGPGPAGWSMGHGADCCVDALMGVGIFGLYTLMCRPLLTGACLPMHRDASCARPERGQTVLSRTSLPRASGETAIERADRSPPCGCRIFGITAQPAMRRHG